MPDPELPYQSRAVDKIILDFTLKACVSLYWHNQTEPWPRKLRGGSCFIIRFASRLVGVTAAHVVREFRDSSAKNQTIICQLHNVIFDLAGAVIDMDEELDIATFAVSEDHLEKIDRIAFDCSTEWPPPPLGRPCALSLAGFPESMRQVREDSSATFAAYGALTVADDFTDCGILVTFDPARDRQVDGAPKPPLKYNLSGCSGGPVIEHKVLNGRRVCFPVGIIVAGAGKCQKGVVREFDMIRIRRIDVIREDGTISRSTAGWLPPAPKAADGEV